MTGKKKTLKLVTNEKPLTVEMVFDKPLESEDKYNPGKRRYAYTLRIKSPGYPMEGGGTFPVGEEVGYYTNTTSTVGKLAAFKRGDVFTIHYTKGPGETYPNFLVVPGAGSTPTLTHPRLNVEDGFNPDLEEAEENRTVAGFIKPTPVQAPTIQEVASNPLPTEEGEWAGTALTASGRRMALALIQAYESVRHAVAHVAQNHDADAALVLARELTNGEVLEKLAVTLFIESR